MTCGILCLTVCLCGLTVGLILARHFVVMACLWRLLSCFVFCFMRLFLFIVLVVFVFVVGGVLALVIVGWPTVDFGLFAFVRCALLAVVCYILILFDLLL